MLQLTIAYEAIEHKLLYVIASAMVDKIACLKLWSSIISKKDQLVCLFPKIDNNLLSNTHLKMRVVFVNTVKT